MEIDFDKALDRETSEDDTHPSPVDRFRLVRKVSSDASHLGNQSVSDLFPIPRALTLEMTTEIESKVNGELALPSPTPVNAGSVLFWKFAPPVGRIHPAKPRAQGQLCRARGAIFFPRRSPTERKGKAARLPCRGRGSGSWCSPVCPLVAALPGRG